MARQLNVISVCGSLRKGSYNRMVMNLLPGSLFLATQVGGEPISAGHGFPVRLVVPGRRGYHWVKWLSRIEAA